MFTVCFVVSLTIWALYAFRKPLLRRLRSRDDTLLPVAERKHVFLIICVALQTFLLLLPLKCSEMPWFFAVLATVYETLCRFVVEGSFREVDAILETCLKDAPLLRTLYRIYLLILYAAAPLTTFSVVLSFFNDPSMWLTLLKDTRADFYVFSELNDNALSIARSIRERELKEKQEKKDVRRIRRFFGLYPFRSESEQREEADIGRKLTDVPRSDGSRTAGRTEEKREKNRRLKNRRDIDTLKSTYRDRSPVLSGGTAGTKSARRAGVGQWASDLLGGKGKAVIIFCDVYPEREERAAELRDEARLLDARCFRRDVSVLHWPQSGKSDRTYYIIGEDEQENIDQALRLLRHYNGQSVEETGIKTDPKDPLAEDRKKLEEAKRTEEAGKGRWKLYLFSIDPNRNLLLNAAPSYPLKPRQVNDVQRLIYKRFYESAESTDADSREAPFDKDAPTTDRDERGKSRGTLFDRGRYTEDEDGNRRINVAVIGLGRYGREIAKTLLWLCQMPFPLGGGRVGRYYVHVECFSLEKDIEGELRRDCPELIEKNRERKEGAPWYDLVCHSGEDVKTADFFERLCCGTDFHRIYVCLGEDRLNMNTAVEIRRRLSREGRWPAIETIVYNYNTALSFRNMQTFRKDVFDIDFFDGLSNGLSEDKLFYAPLEEETRDVQRDYLEKRRGVLSNIEGESRLAKEYGQYENEMVEADLRWEYNYRSSASRAVYDRLRKHLWRREYSDGWREYERALAQYEHLRWIVYMRTEGYSYGEKTDHLAKLHRDMIPFPELYSSMGNEWVKDKPRFSSQREEENRMRKKREEEEKRALERAGKNAGPAGGHR